MSVLSVRGLSKVYGQGHNQVRALNHIELEIEKGEFIAIMGTSGSGKSTLLNMISGLDTYDQGEILISGENIKGVYCKIKVQTSAKNLYRVLHYFCA